MKTLCLRGALTLVVAIGLGGLSLSRAAPPIGGKPAPPVPAPRPSPPILPRPPAPPVAPQGPIITAFKSAPPPTGGGPGTAKPATASAKPALAYAVDVTNASDEPLTTTLTVKRSIADAEPFTLSLPITLGPRQSTTSTFVDARGFEDGCSPMRYDLGFAGKKERTGKATPACTFHVATSGAATSPQTSGFLYHEGASLRTTPTCNEKVDVVARVVNGGSEQANVKLSLAFPGNTPEQGLLVPSDNAYAQSPSVVLGAKEGKELSTSEGQPFTGKEGTYPLTIWRLPFAVGGIKTVARVPVARPTWSITVKRACTVTAALE